MTTIAVKLPTIAVEQVNQWSDASGLARDKFYSTALILGARAMTSSIRPDFVVTLTPEVRKYMSDSANAGVTPQVLRQIVAGDKAQAIADDPEPATSELVVSLPEDMATQFREAAEGIGMAREKFHALAFVMGARLAASTLEQNSIFPLELLMQSTQGDVTPEMVMQAMVRRNAQAKSRKASDGKKQ